MGEWDCWMIPVSSLYGLVLTHVLEELAVGEDRVWIIYIKPLHTDVDLHHYLPRLVPQTR